jgi:hypothetical protein
MGTRQQPAAGPDFLRPISDGAIARDIVAGRLNEAFQAKEFKPPYPTWPFRANAFDGTVNWLPRQLLQQCDRHLRQCLAQGRVTEMESLFNDEKGEGLFPVLLLDALRCYARQTDLPRDVDLVGA